MCSGHVIVQAGLRLHWARAVHFVILHALAQMESACKITEIGEACGGNDDCPDNAMCSSALCQCDGGFYKKADSTGCDPVREYFDLFYEGCSK